MSMWSSETTIINGAVLKSHMSKKLKPNKMKLFNRVNITMLTLLFAIISCSDNNNKNISNTEKDTLVVSNKKENYTLNDLISFSKAKYGFVKNDGTFYCAPPRDTTKYRYIVNHTKKLYVDKMISMFKQKHINTPSPKWDSDSEDNASTDDGKNEEDS